MGRGLLRLLKESPLGGRRFAKVLALAALVLAVTASAGSAATPRPVGPLGVVPHAGTFDTARSLAATATAGSNNVQYHNGWVMRTNTTYAIYWIPSGYQVAPGYESGIDGYLANVAADSGQTSNVYSDDTQYYDTTGEIAYRSTYGGSYVDTKSFPANGCNDHLDSICLTDAQMSAEIQRVVSLEGWPDGKTSLFFLMTPEGVGSCFESNGVDCTTNSYCAYHSDVFNTDGQPVVYAIQPYVASIEGCNSTPGGSPNGPTVDTALNTISHEQNEAITDPNGDAWWDSSGDEIGDKCAWRFGASLGTTTGGQAYNQLIDGHPYSLQEEWSNNSSSCVQRYGSSTLPVDTSAPVVSGIAGVGRTLSTTRGTWSGAPTSYTFGWERCDAYGQNCEDIPSATGTTYRLTAADAGYTLRSKVSAANAQGSSAFAYAKQTAIVAPFPTVAASPAVSGRTIVGKTLSTTAGTWNTASVTFSYRWLRCTAGGNACAAISGATRSTYLLMTADAGHAIEARVTATNAAGAVSATSAATAIVQRAPAAAGTPHIIGRAAVGNRLTASVGYWRGMPTRFGFQWLRCSSAGGSCVAIAGATHAGYTVGKRDIDHRLRVRVTAGNALGHANSRSAPTRVVPA